MAAKYEEIRDKIENGVYKLASNGRSARSTVWRLFRKIHQEDGSILENVLYCTSCHNLMSFTHKSTTNLRRHKCHLRYLKKLTQSEERESPAVVASGLDTNPDMDGTKQWFKTSDSDDEMRVGESLVETELAIDNESNPDREEDQSQNDKIKKSRNEKDTGNFMSVASNCSSGAGVSLLQSQSQSYGSNDPLNVAENFSSTMQTQGLSHVSASDPEESTIYAQTWSLEYRKLTEEQKFYAKRAIDEIFVLGRLRRLTLNTVPSITD